jgi:hypothetical protein
VTLPSDDMPRMHGLSGDHGWNDSDEVPLDGLRSLLFVVTGMAYFGSVWLLSGLAPLPMLVTYLRSNRTVHTKLSVDVVSTSTTNWRKTAA